MASGSGKTCATCSHWCGSRKDQSHMSSCTVLLEDTYGRCSCSNAGPNHYNKEVFHNNNCSCWERWTKN